MQLVLKDPAAGGCIRNLCPYHDTYSNARTQCWDPETQQLAWDGKGKGLRSLPAHLGLSSFGFHLLQRPHTDQRMMRLTLLMLAGLLVTLANAGEFFFNWEVLVFVTLSIGFNRYICLNQMVVEYFKNIGCNRWFFSKFNGAAKTVCKLA